MFLETLVSNMKLPNSVVNKQLNEETIPAKLAPETKTDLDILTKNENSSLKSMLPSTSMYLESVNVTSPKTAEQTETEKNQNTKDELKSLLLPGNKLEKLSPSVVTHNNVGNVPEVETQNKEIQSSVNVKNMNTSPESSTVITPKNAPNSIDDSIDDNDKATTDDEIRGENDEVAPGETKEKGDAGEFIFLRLLIGILYYSFIYYLLSN